MYSELFEKTGIKRGILWPYQGSDLQGLHNTTTHPWGYVELMISIGEEKDAWLGNSQLLIVPRINANNCIMGRPSASTLDVVASLVHFKLKYHNLQKNRSPSMSILWEQGEYIKCSSEIRRRHINENRCGFPN